MKIKRMPSSLEEENENLREALQHIVKWSEAYPIDIFHVPTKYECRMASDALEAIGLCLDMFSASMGRHCLEGIGRIAKDALKEVEVIEG